MTHVYSDRDDGSIKISTISVRALSAPVVLAFASAFFFASVNAAVIDFEGYQPGRIIDDEYAPDVLINGLNFRYGAGPSRSVVFDSDNPTGGDIPGSFPTRVETTCGVSSTLALSKACGVLSSRWPVRAQLTT
jgi:hypothetical protein